jgi:hypothetical protein
MSQLNFPTNPSPGDTWTIGENTWVWNGAAWIKSTSSKNIVNVFTVTNTLYVTSTTNSTSTTTGALQVTGGVGVGGSVYVGQRVGFVNTSNQSVVYLIYNSSTNSLDTVFE